MLRVVSTATAVVDNKPTTDTAVAYGVSRLHHPLEIAGTVCVTVRVPPGPRRRGFQVSSFLPVWPFQAAKCSAGLIVTGAEPESPAVLADKNPLPLRQCLSFKRIHLVFREGPAPLMVVHAVYHSHPYRSHPPRLSVLVR